jgi:iron complex transport system ATP-binding protein
MKKLINQQKLIEYKNVTVSRNNRMVLNGINLTISLGEHAAILGPNGAGKSFLIKTINRECYPLYNATDSYLRIMGKENWNIFELRNQLGIVSSDLVNMHTRNVTGHQAILSGFFSSVGIWAHDVVTPLMEQKVREVLERLEITHLIERKMDELSTGEVRRILIGRALVHNPKALLLDEPSASLDFRAAHELRELLGKIANEGTSVIIVTHNLTDIIPVIDRVILIKEGRIFQDGLKEKVLTARSLNQLFSMSLKITVEDGYYHMS